jgi:hypothetical protein
MHVVRGILRVRQRTYGWDFNCNGSFLLTLNILEVVGGGGWRFGKTDDVLIIFYLSARRHRLTWMAAWDPAGAWTVSLAARWKGWRTRGPPPSLRACMRRRVPRP